MSIGANIMETNFSKESINSENEKHSDCGSFFIKMKEKEDQQNQVVESNHIRTSSSKNINFYKNYDIYSYRKPEFKTKYV